MSIPLHDPELRKLVLVMGEAYGGHRFWQENLTSDSSPDATWRAALYCGCLGCGAAIPALIGQLRAPDSRVRAAACTALALIGGDPPNLAAAVAELLNDPVSRVRFSARRALRALRPEDPAARPVRRQASALLLVSDDSPAEARAYFDVFAPYGIRVLHAASEQETIEIALRRRPDAIITDNQKGKDNLSGLHMTWDIARIPDLRDVPVLMCTQDRVGAVFTWFGGDVFACKLDVPDVRSLLGATIELCAC